MEHTNHWDGSERRSRLAATDTDTDKERMERPFWKVMGFVLMSLFGVLVWVLSVALAKLDKLNDSQIETKTMMTVLIAQQNTSQSSINEQSTIITDLKMKYATLETTMQQHIEATRRDRR